MVSVGVVSVGVVSVGVVSVGEWYSLVFLKWNQRCWMMLNGAG